MLTVWHKRTGTWQMTMTSHQQTCKSFSKAIMTSASSVVHAHFHRLPAPQVQMVCLLGPHFYISNALAKVANVLWHCLLHDPKKHRKPQALSICPPFHHSQASHCRWTHGLHAATTALGPQTHQTIPGVHTLLTCRELCPPTAKHPHRSEWVSGHHWGETGWEFCSHRYYHTWLSSHQGCHEESAGCSRIVHTRQTSQTAYQRLENALGEKCLPDDQLIPEDGAVSQKCCSVHRHLWSVWRWLVDAAGWACEGHGENRLCMLGLQACWQPRHDLAMILAWPVSATNTFIIS